MDKTDRSKMIARIASNIVIITGLFLLARILRNVASCTLAAQFFDQSQYSLIWTGYALGLSLPVPFHLISIGLFLQRKRLSPRWARSTRIAVIVSGCWLGAALGIKILILQ